MTPVDMTILNHNPKEGIFGDCFRCCIASLLELSAARVPNFCGYDWTVEGTEESRTRWFRNTNAWLVSRGLSFIEFQMPDGGLDSAEKWMDSAVASGFDAYHILSGKSPRGHNHAVVAKNGKIVFDPHPSRDGLCGPDSDGVYSIGFLIHRGAA